MSIHRRSEKYRFMAMGFITGALIVGAATWMSLGRGVNIKTVLAGPKYQLTNPVLKYEYLNKPDGRLAGVRGRLVDYIRQRTAGGSVKDIAVYIRDLNNGPWIGIGEDKDFSPASLLKIPILMAYYKIAEDTPHILLHKLKYEDAQLKGAAPAIVPREQLQLGKEYTVDDLIHRMIVHSDNAAKNLLLSHIPPEHLRSTFANMHMYIPSINMNGDYISVVDYASIFRILYNASYLNRRMSEKALQLLRDSDFSDGISAGVPSRIMVAHKFGEREDDTGVMQLHDCGIVYYPKSPYLICIMTKGNDIAELKQAIRDISRITYEHKELTRKTTH